MPQIPQTVDVRLAKLRRRYPKAAAAMLVDLSPGIVYDLKQQPDQDPQQGKVVLW